MRIATLFMTGVLLLSGCAAYKQLEPEPELSSEEKGYIELKHGGGKKDFELKEGKGYFIAFPAPDHDNYFLVLTHSSKKAYNSFLTFELEDKKTPGEKIPDRAAEDTALSVYPIGEGVESYYWLVDSVKDDIVLQMKYRYVPQWRFKFENRHAALKETLENNRVDRSVYEKLGKSFQFDGFNYRTAMDTVKQSTRELETVLEELTSIESIFPSSILDSRDPAYLNYKKLKGELKEEILFQRNYFAVLDFFGKEEKTRGNTAGFIELTGDFIQYFGRKEKLADNVSAESRRVLENRLREVAPFYDQKLAVKENADPLDNEGYHIDSFLKLRELYKTAGVQPTEEFLVAAKFIEGFQDRALLLAKGKNVLDKIHDKVAALEKMPEDDFFAKAAAKTEEIQNRMPRPLGEEMGKYLNYLCATRLNRELAQFTDEVTKLAGRYGEAKALVPQINRLMAQGNFRGSLGVLMQYKHLGFLLEKYRPLDKMSIEQQADAVSDHLANYRWRSAEAGLRALHGDRNFIDPPAVFSVKRIIVEELEDSLYSTIDRITRHRVNEFLEQNVDQLENVDSLYTDSVFYPVYEVTFTTGDQADLEKRKRELVEHLATMKQDEFPARAIALLYQKFVRDPGKNGVLTARAIVRHGEHYEGDNIKIKRRVAECNPWASKWIVKPKKYRRVYALPLTDSRGGSNRYLVRLNVRIPTDAKFPVYDVNIKLPKEIAGEASTEQWYEKIMLNKTPLKNEGRFTITAPTAENNFECQVSPVRMVKEGNNVLEIYFNHKSFKVHTLSVMVQKPIIKKN
ncbi:MAG: hypothetical protein GF344_12835 [Chitinivibrionales bacterium]|nr:hypothetical protein [Chitinivibrionales bacterium]MBD3357628.1 hypothetical protein [Chitinivibrionales bacterium]